MVVHIDSGDGGTKCGTNVYYDNYPNGYNAEKVVLPIRKISNRYILFENPEKGLKADCKRCLNTGFKTEFVPITENYLGKIFYSSWGYDMTINDYAKVIKQQGAVLTLQECLIHIENDNGMGSGKSWAGDIKPDGKIFNLKQIKTKRGYIHFTKYDRHYWSLWDGKTNYYNTWD